METGRGCPVGIVGSGLIGTAMARRLLAADFSVLAYDIDPAKAAGIEAIGGRTAASLGDLAEACDRVILAVFNTNQVEDALEGPEGLLSRGTGKGRGKIFVAVSTCDPERIRPLGERLRKRGVTLLECPLSGTSDQVVRGDGVALVAGDAARIAEIEDLLGALTKRYYVVGTLGNGNKAKLAVNLILGLNRAALAEGLVYAERLGLPLDPFLDVARGSAAYSQIMDVKGGKMIAGDFTPHGKVVQSHKDFSLILRSAADAGQHLPLASVYARLMQDCIDKGEGEWDNAAVIEAIRRTPAA